MAAADKFSVYLSNSREGHDLPRRSPLYGVDKVEAERIAGSEPSGDWTPSSRKCCRTRCRRGHCGYRRVSCCSGELTRHLCFKALSLLLFFLLVRLGCWVWPSSLSVKIALATSVVCLGAGNGAMLAALRRSRSKISVLEKMPATANFRVSTESVVIISQWKGVVYRKSKFLEDEVTGDIAYWDTTIIGIDEEDGWIRVHDALGDKFLPSSIRGHLVLQKQDPLKGADNCHKHLRQQLPTGKGKTLPPPGNKGKGSGKDGQGKGKGKGQGAELPTRRMEKVTPKVQVKRLFWDPLHITDSKPTFWSQISPEDNKDERIAVTSTLDKFFNMDQAPNSATSNAALASPALSPSAQSVASGKGEKKLKVLDSKRRKEICILRACLPRLPEIRSALVHMKKESLTMDHVEVLAKTMPSEAEVKTMEKAKMNNDEDLRNGSCFWDVAEEFMDNLLSIPQLELRIQIWVFENSFSEQLGFLKIAHANLSHAIKCVRESQNIKHLLQIALFAGNYLNGGTSRGRADGFTLDCLTQLRTVKMTPKESGGGTLIDYIVWQMERAHKGSLSKMQGPGEEFELLKEAARHGLKDRLSEVENLALSTAHLLETVRAHCEEDDDPEADQALLGACSSEAGENGEASPKALLGACSSEAGENGKASPKALLGACSSEVGENGEASPCSPTSAASNEDLPGPSESAEARAARESLKPHRDILNEHLNEVKALQKEYKALEKNYADLLDWFMMPREQLMTTMDFFGIFSGFLVNVATALKKYENEQRLREAEKKARELQLRAQSKTTRRHSMSGGFRHRKLTNGAEADRAAGEDLRLNSARRKTWCHVPEHGKISRASSFDLEMLESLSEQPPLSECSGSEAGGSMIWEPTPPTSQSFDCGVLQQSESIKGPSRSRYLQLPARNRMRMFTE